MSCVQAPKSSDVLMTHNAGLEKNKKSKIIRKEKNDWILNVAKNFGVMKLCYF